MELCRKQSLKVLSLCSKQIYAEVKPLVWKRVEVRWEFLEGSTKELIKKPNPNLQLTSSLFFLGAGSPTSILCGDRGFGFFSFLDRCDRLKSLTICHFLPADGLNLVREILPQLENLKLTDISLRDYLKPLVGLRQLKSLTLEQCWFQKSDWDVLWLMESLEHLTMTHGLPPDFDDFTPRDGFRLKNLLSLNFLATVESRDLYSCIAKTSVKLESLDLGSSSIQDSDMLNLSSLPHLKIVHLFGADQITDIGISYLTNLPCLEILEVGACARLSPRCLEDIGKIQTLRHLELVGFSEDANDISSLSNLANLSTLVISQMPGLTDDALKVAAQLKSL